MRPTARILEAFDHNSVLCLHVKCKLSVSNSLHQLIQAHSAVYYPKLLPPPLPPTEPLLRGSSSSRKLAQWGYSRRGGGWGSNGNAQFARNSAAIVNTQYAIRNAVESGASLPATAGAAYYGNEQAYLASQRWPTYGGWWGGR